MELATLTDDDLTRLLVEVRGEQMRRAALVSAITSTPSLAAPYLADLGRGDGAEWVQPLGAFDAYPEEWVVEHAGRQWVSLTPANTHEPGVSGWREVVEPGGVPAWVQPLGAHDAYNKGDTVTHEGVTWVSDVDGNVWSPGVHGWTQTN